MIKAQLINELKRFENHHTIIVKVDGIMYELDPDMTMVVFTLDGKEIVGAELRATEIV